MTDKARAEPTVQEQIRTAFDADDKAVKNIILRRAADALDALDAKDAEIARLRKVLIRAEGAMANAAPNGDMRDALLVARSALWD